MDYQSLINSIQAIDKPRKIIAIAGTPASGKSTLAEKLAKDIPNSALLAMDGFHLDDCILNERGHRARKGAPHTYDVNGFYNMLERIALGEDDVFAPSFDRGLELSRNASVLIPSSASTIIVEGNYLLLDDPKWALSIGLFDLTIMLEVPIDEIEKRLLQRWYDHGFDEQRARDWIDSNDFPNAKLVAENSLKADLVFSGELPKD